MAHNAGLFRIGNPNRNTCIGFSVNAAPLSWWHWDDNNTFYDLPKSKMPNPDEPFITKMRYKGEASAQPTRISLAMEYNRPGLILGTRIF